MFFILSKVLYFLLVPAWWVILLLISLIFIRSQKWRKVIFTAIVVILIVFTNPFIYRTAVLQWQPEPVTLSNASHYDAGILLGGMAGYDKYNRGHFGAAADRFIQAANLYHSGYIGKIIISGGTGSLSQAEPAEAFFLKKSLLENGIPDSAIIVESRSRNTYENGLYTKIIIDSLGMKGRSLLITSALHMRRSQHVFRKAGFDFDVFPCDFKVMQERTTVGNTIFPAISLLDEWSYFLKEMVGLTVYKMTGKA